MMGLPTAEIEPHYERYREFFETYDITIDDPLGEFRPTERLPDAPSTPANLDAPEQPHAEGGFADDVYVEGPDGELRVGGWEEPEDVDVTDASGVDGNELQQ
jgi:hypothetical protein